MPFLATLGVGSIGAYVRRRSSAAPPTIGQSFGGGYYAGQISTAGNGVADYYLVVAPASSGQSAKQWKTTNSATSGTKSLIDGPTNSSNMNDASHPAAQFCKGLSIGGYSDWYMPAKNELEVCYYNLKPTTTTNDTSTGTNANSVPSRGNYSSGTPAQTSATDFQVTGTERFLTSTYWSSTEYISVGDYAWKQSFSNGIQQYDTKNGTEYVRAVRRVPV